MAPKDMIRTVLQKYICFVVFSLLGGDSREEIVAFPRYLRLKSEDTRKINSAVTIDKTDPFMEIKEKE